jgi:hypothetical protein
VVKQGAALLFLHGSGNSFAGIIEHIRATTKIYPHSAILFWLMRMAEPFKYTLKTDPQGMVGRECPKCKTYFKVPLKETDCEDMVCPACGARLQCKKFTTIPQVDYINSLIFHREGCPIEHNVASRTPPCHDYVEMPAKCVWGCDVCQRKFGLDNKKPDFCPYCNAAREHLHEEYRCDLK